MSEKAPSSSQEQQLSRREREELFGKYDENVTPAEGEVTYEQYLAQRPDTGVYRIGNQYHSSKGGFASKEAIQAHEAQREANIRQSKNSFGGLDRMGVEEAPEQALPNYEDMTREELINEAVKARILGDKALDMQIRAEYEERLTMDIVNKQDDSESPEEAQKRYDAELKAFNNTVDSEVEEHLLLENNATREIYSGDEKVSIDKFFDGPDGERLVKVVTSTGEAKYVPKEDLVTKEVIFEAPDTSEKEPTRTERVKGWIKKQLKDIQRFGGAAYWAEKFGRAMGGAFDATLNMGVKETMTPEEQDKVRKRNRRVLQVGLGVVAAAALYKIGESIHDSVSASGDVVDPSNLTPTHFPSPETTGIEDASSVVDQVSNPPFYDMDSEGTLSVETPSIPVEAFNIPSGGGGEQLMRQLGVDPQKWYSIENSLLERFPNDFYRMNDGHVGLMRPGMLPQPVQEAIIQAVS